MKNINKVKTAIAVILVAIIAISIGFYAKFKPQTDNITKTIFVTVSADGKEEKFDISTNAQYLSQALDELKLIDGYDGEYGLFVTTVNGRSVDTSKEEWWCFTKGGDVIMTGVDITPISDGDKFEITLKSGYN